ncbi:hypothetical protein Pcinc_040827 [Petrolisthes cinctipes]|uniref:Uncharacterized protein n=1 Tax=Petrolisthes cinctipes TaxID=88211 RepID=A0AAE1EKG0_PETCI|nr:hypothetical protein Pcinc_040827 [Petrolisthes cinctipes]
MGVGSGLDAHLACFQTMCHILTFVSVIWSTRRRSPDAGFLARQGCPTYLPGPSPPPPSTHLLCQSLPYIHPQSTPSLYPSSVSPYLIPVLCKPLPYTHPQSTPTFHPSSVNHYLSPILCQPLHNTRPLSTPTIHPSSVNPYLMTILMPVLTLYPSSVKPYLSPILCQPLYYTHTLFVSIFKPSSKFYLSSISPYFKSTPPLPDPTFLLSPASSNPPPPHHTSRKYVNKLNFSEGMWSESEVGGNTRTRSI